MMAIGKKYLPCIQRDRTQWLITKLTTSSQAGTGRKEKLTTGKEEQAGHGWKSTEKKASLALLHKEFKEESFAIFSQSSLSGREGVNERSEERKEEREAFRTEVQSKS
jgi:hypothetical protein